MASSERQRRVPPNQISRRQAERPARVLVAATPLTGHTRPLLSVAGGLANGGWQVTFLGGSRFANDARDVGAQFLPLHDAADYDDRRLAELYPERLEVPAGLARLAFDQHWLFADAIAPQNASIQEFLGRHPDAAVIHDAPFMGAIPQLLGAPGHRARRIVAVGVTPVALPGLELTPFGPPAPVKGMDVRGSAAVANSRIDAALQPATDYFNEVLAHLGATRRIPQQMRAMYEIPDAVAQLTVPAFEFPRVDAPRSLHLIGPLRAEPPTGWDPPPWWTELPHHRVVVVTQGTMANDDLNDLVQPTLDALSDMDVVVVAALGRDARPGELRVPDNARVAAFVPYDALMPHAAALVTNGGYGTVQLAIGHRVPAVVAGQSEDKAMVATRVATFGVGVNLGTDHPTASGIARAVAEVLDNPVYRDNTNTIAEQYAACDPIAAIADLLA